MGEIKNLYITNNIIKHTNTYSSKSSFLTTSKLYDYKDIHVPSLNGNFNVFGNTFEGMKTILLDDSSNYTSSLLVLNLNVRNNFMNTNGTKQLINICGGNENTITSNCILENNSYNDFNFIPTLYNKDKIKDDTKIFLQYRKSASQAITQNTQTIVTFPTFELDDNSSNVSSSSGLRSYSSDGVFTTKINGWYTFKVSIQLQDVTETSIIQLGLYKNDTEVKRFKYGALGSTLNVFSEDARVFLSVGDIVDVRITVENSGNDATIQANAPRSYIQIIKDN